MIFNNLSLLSTTTIILYYLPCVFADPETNSAGIPSYVFAIVVIVLVIIILVALFFIIRLIRHRRKIRNRTSKTNTTTTSETTEPYTSTTIEEKKLSPITHTKNHHESIEIDCYHSEDSTACPPVPPLSPSTTHYEDIKITLPLPPASTSLFSDKVELSSDEAAELYKKYMDGDGGFVLIEDSNNNNNNHRRFSTMQQKAATIRSTLRQSLRRQRSLKNVSSSSQTPLKDLFDRSPSQHSSVSGASSSSSSSSSSKRMPPSPSPLPSSYSTRTTSSNIIIPTPPSPALTSPRTPNTPVTPLTPTPPLVTRPFSEKVALDENYEYQQETPTLKHDDAEPYIDHNAEQPQDYTPLIPPTPTLTITPEIAPIIPSTSQSSLHRSSTDVTEDKEMKIEQEQIGQQNRKASKAAETEARKVIEFASIRSKRRSFLSDLRREQEEEKGQEQEQKQLSLTASSSHSDVSRNNPSVRDIISWWQKEPSIKSSPSGHSITPSTLTKSKHVEQQQEKHERMNSTSSPSVLSPSLKQQQPQQSLIDPPISNETAKSTSPTSVRELPVSRQSSLMRPASSLFTGVNESPRASLNSLSRLSTAERMVIMGGNNSISSKPNNVESVRQSLQATWSSDHSASSSSTASSMNSQQTIQPPSQHQHLLSMRGQHHWQQRPAMPEEFMHEQLEGPVPTASFSSSTVRTMIPENEYQEQAIAISKNTNNKIQQQRQQQQGSFSRNNPINQRQSISPTVTTSSTRKNVSSLKPSVNKTTHTNTVASRKQTTSTTTTTTNTGTYSTMRGGRKQQRGSIPWLQNNDSNSKTPAQREKDRYLHSLEK